jgi:hypothetical protein
MPRSTFYVIHRRLSDYIGVRAIYKRNTSRNIDSREAGLGCANMPTLIEHYKLEDGNEWAVLADGGSDYESIQTYICVPAGDLDKPAEELGKAVASLHFGRRSCAPEMRVAP